MDKHFWQQLDTLLTRSWIVIDRRRDTAHPRYPDMIYPLDYGYLAGTTTVDGGGVDVWLGELSHDPPQIQAVLVQVDLGKHDIELKILVNCTQENIETIQAFIHDNEMACLLVKRDNCLSDT